MIEELKKEFEVLQEVGRGGMGVVYKARQMSLDRVVAVKMLMPEYANNEDFINRFKREAKVIAALNHQNIVDIYDIIAGTQTWFIITEFVGGGTLRDLIKKQKRIPLDEATRIIYDTCSALYYTHRKDIVHRDIKPDNVMFTESREVKVTDFGLATMSHSSFQTRSGLRLGTPSYIAPERARGLANDHRSDLYSLGVMFFEMITSHLPFEADDEIGVIYKHIHEKPPRPTSLNKELPEWVDKVLLKCLEKDPKDRYTDCGALGKALEPYVATPARVGWTGPMPDKTALDLKRTVQMDRTRVSSRSSQESKKKILIPVLGLLLVIAAAGGLYLVKPDLINKVLKPTPTPISQAQRPTPGPTAKPTPVQFVEEEPTAAPTPDSSPMFLADAKTLLKAGKFSEAKLKLNKVLDLNPIHQEARDLLADLSILQEIAAVRKLKTSQGFQSALLSAQKLSDENPGSEEAKKFLQDLRAEEAQIAKLRDEMEKALAASDFQAAASSAGQILVSLPGDQDAAKAKETAESGLATMAATAKVEAVQQKLAVAREMMKFGKYNDIPGLVGEVTALAGSIPGEQGAGFQAEATQMLTAAKQVPLMLVAITDVDLKNPNSASEAKRVCDEILKLNPQDPSATRILSSATAAVADLDKDFADAMGEARDALGKADLDRAGTATSKALALKPSDPEAVSLSDKIKGFRERFLLATQLYSDKKYDQAKKESEGLLKELPGFSKAAEMVARCDEEIGRIPEPLPPGPSQPAKPAPQEPQLAEPEPAPVQPSFKPGQPVTQPRPATTQYVPGSAIGATGEVTVKTAVDVCASSSALYVVDADRGLVVKFSLQGEYVGTLGAKSGFQALGTEPKEGDLVKPCGVAVDKEENIYILDSGFKGVHKFDKDGKFLLRWDSSSLGGAGFGSPSGIATAPDGSIYVVDKDRCRVYKFNASGQRITEWGEPGIYEKAFKGPLDLCVDNQGYVYVADTENNKVQKFEGNGGYRNYFPADKGIRPIALAVDATGDVYVADETSSTILKYATASGQNNKCISVIGEHDKLRIRSPQGLTVTPDGSVLLAHPNKQRVERFDPQK